jgi:proline dehydrogenase
VTTCAAPLLRRRASAYRAGPALDDALAATRRLAARGLASTIGYSAAPGEEAPSVADAHVAAFEALVVEEADCYVSVKLSALAFDEASFGRIVAAAARVRRRLHVDAVAPEAVEPTWRLLEGVAGTATLGTTLPARWRRSTADAARAAELGLDVRVVKGQWPDPEGDRDPRTGFIELVDRLRDHPRTVALATHDVPLLAEALRRLAGRGAPSEVELFYGLPFRGPALEARGASVAVRMYVPYGHAGAPYSRDTTARSPVAAWWLAQDLLLGEDKTWRSIRRTPLRS